MKYGIPVEPGSSGRDCIDGWVAKSLRAFAPLREKRIGVRLGWILETENSCAQDARKSMKITDKCYANIRKQRENSWFCFRSLVKQNDLNGCHNKMIYMVLHIHILMG